MSNIRFNVIDWREYDIEITNESDEETILNNKEYIIELYGRTAKDDPEYPDKTVYLKVLQYYPHFYLRLPDRFTEYNLRSLTEHVLENLCPKKYQDSLISYDLVEKYRFYGFTNNKLYKFGLFVFKNIEAMRKFSYIFLKPIRTTTLNEYKYELHETNISPMLRFMHKQNIKSCGWVSVSNYSESNYANTNIQIEAKWKDVISFDNPKYSSLKILSFDIECISEDGSFPQPERKNDKIITICSTITRYSTIEPEEIWAFSLKKCLDFNDSKIKLINCKTEKELLLKWSESILEIDPDIITGYNISGFDELYLYKRAKLLGIEEKFSSIGRKCGSCKFEEQKLSSSALGDNVLKFYDIPGRIMIDMLKVVQRDHKLTSYKLDNVAEHFIKGDIKKYEIKDNKTILTISKTHLLKIGNYIKFTINDEKYKNSEKYVIETINNNEITINTNMIDFVINNENEIKWGLAKDDVKPYELFQLYNEGTEEGIHKITKYCIMDCALINMLIGILEILNNNMAMATVCSVPLSYIFLRGQGIKIFSLIAKACKENNYIIPVIRPNKNEQLNEDDTYEGAICFTPQIGFYDMPITVLDYGSLYPSSMIDLNMSLETIILDDRYRGLKGFKYNDIWYKSDPLKDKPDKKVTFAIPENNQRGIVPKILQYLLDARNETRAKQKNVVDGALFAILEGLQLAYKVTANSLYGQMGAKTSSVYMKEIAASTTARGREMLEFGRDYVEQEFSKILEMYIENIDNEYDSYFDNIIIGHNDIMKSNKLLLAYWEQVFSRDKYELLKKQLENPNENILDEVLKNEFNKRSKFVEIMHKKYFKQYNFKIEPKIIYGDTDSNFINWNMINKKTGELMKGKHLVGLSIEMGKLVEKHIKPLLPFPHKWNYEKTFYPFCILAKKRYIGMKYEFTDDHNYLSYMGIVLKRRDNARIVKKVISGLINIMMEQIDNSDPTRIINYMRKQIDKILNGEYPLDDFELSKTLKGSYTLSNDNELKYFNNKITNKKSNNTDEESTKNKKHIVSLDNNGWYIKKNDERLYMDDLCPNMVHVVLAERVRKRDPGNAFNLNDRIPFIYIEKKTQKGVKLLQGDMVEIPEYIFEKKLKVDYLFYITNQIMNPAVQLLEVLMPNPQALFDEYIKKEKDRKNGVQGLEKWGIISTKIVDNNQKILKNPNEKKTLGKSKLPKVELKPKKLMELKN
jgi:DNA polymerase elongation subunit (family B)